jgi:hypothetical protein
VAKTGTGQIGLRRPTRGAELKKHKSSQEKTGEEFMTKRSIMWTMSTAALLGCSLAIAQADPLMIVGDDEKLLWDDNTKPLIHPPARIPF